MKADKRDLQTHWEKVYHKNEKTKLGWYEKNPDKSLELIQKCNLNKNDRIIDVGAGAALLVNELLNQEYTDIVALDISQTALNILADSIDKKYKDRVTYITDDLSKAEKINEIGKVSLWHDRAVLHFLTDENDRNTYLDTLKNVVKVGGFVIISVFSLSGAKMCSGLNVMNYDRKMLEEFMGNEFKLVDHFEYTYLQPSGNERPFIYTLFQRI